MHDVQQVDEQSPAARVQDGIRFLQRRYPRILLTAFASAALAAVVSQSLEPRYRSTAELLVESAPEQDGQPANARDESSFVDGQVIVLKSFNLLKGLINDPTIRNNPEIAGTEEPTLTGRGRDVLNTAASFLGLGLLKDPTEDEYPEIEEDPASDVVRRLREMISVTREGNSPVISISVVAGEPRLAAYVANILVETYMAQEAEMRVKRNERITTWHNSRILELREKLRDAEKAVQAYGAQHGFLTSEMGTVAEQQLSGLKAQLIQTQVTLYEKQTNLESAQNILRSGGDLFLLRDLMDSQVLSELRLRLFEVTQRETEIVTFYGEGNASLEPVRAEKANLALQIETEIERIIGMLTHELEVTKARESLLISALSQATDVLTMEARRQVELRDLERVAEAYSETYRQLLERAGSAAAWTGATSSEVRLISPASVPKNAVFPPDKMIVVLGLILGAGLGIVWASAKEGLNTRVVTSKQAKAALGFPVLAAFPPTVGPGSPKDLVMRVPSSPFAEAVRSLRHTLLHEWQHQGAAPILQIASALAGEGKTTMATNLALSAVAVGYRTLLVDADLHRRDLTMHFSLEDRPGLTDLAEDETSFERVIARTEIDRLSVLPAGIAATSSQEFPDANSLTALLNWVRTRFDLVILDGPEVGNMSDAVVLSKRADLVLYMVKWNSTPIDIVRDCLNRIEPSKIMGIGLNEVNIREAARYGDSFARFERLRAG